MLSLCIGIYLALTAKNKGLITKKIRYAFIILLIAISLWMLITIDEIGFIDTIYSPSSPIAYLPIVLVLLGGDESCWNILKKIAPIFATIYFLLCYTMYKTLVVDMCLAVSGNTPLTVYLVSTVWWLAVCAVAFKSYKIPYKALTIALLIFCGLIAFRMTYRSWIIQSGLLLLIIAFQFGNNKVMRLLIGLLCVFLLSVFVNNIVGSSDYSDAMLALENKNKIDTRGFQYTDVFKQIPLSTWIFGGGIKASYISSFTGKEYSYIDNQYLFTALHYGIFILMPWLIVWLKGVVGLVAKRNTTCSQKLPAYVCILWLLALGGLSVFNAICLNSQNLIMSIILGRCIYLTDKRKQEVLAK